MFVNIKLRFANQKNKLHHRKRKSCAAYLQILFICFVNLESALQVKPQLESLSKGHRTWFRTISIKYIKYVFGANLFVVVYVPNMVQQSAHAKKLTEKR